MSEIHRNDIRQLLATIPAIPQQLLSIYLQRQYNVTPNAANEILYDACRGGTNRRPVAYVTQYGLARAAYITSNSQIESQCKAFRAAIEFLPESRSFSIPSVQPWLMCFSMAGQVYYICDFKQGEEYIQSDIIREAGIRREMMPLTNRIAILSGANRNKIQKCGIKYFCTVDRDFNIAVTERIANEEVWDGVPIIE